MMKLISLLTSIRGYFRRISVRAIIVIGMGVILLLALAIALIGGITLWNLRTITQTNLEDANKASELSLRIQTVFLGARQYESDLLLRWRTEGYITADSINVSVNIQQA